MSCYVKEKVLRVPLLKYGYDAESFEDLFCEEPLFSYGKPFHFSISPTETLFLDYILESTSDEGANEYGKTRELYETEKNKYRELFQKFLPNINMNDVRLVEFCWYNCTEAPDYYDKTTDDFYKEV